jgi:hypothetical protein
MPGEPELSHREVSVVEVREAVRAWMAGAGTRTTAARAGVDRKTASRYVKAAEAVGVVRDGGVEQLTDEVIGEIVGLVRPVRPDGHGQAWETLLGHQEQIAEWVKADLTVVKIHDFLTRMGVVVPYRTLVRFCEQHCGFAGRQPRQTGLRRAGPTARPAHGAAAQDVGVGVHGRVLAAPVRVVDALADAGGGDRRLRGGVEVLRRRIQRHHSR